MNFRITCLIAFITLFTLHVQTVQAQSFGKKLKEKVMNKLENKGDEKIDQALDSAVDKPVDKTEEKVKESVKDGGDEPSEGQSGADQNAQMQQWLNSMGGGAVTLEDYPESDAIEPSQFKGSFDMEVETWKNDKKKDEGTIAWHIREYDLVMLPEAESGGKNQRSRIIIDRKKGIMIVISDDGGSKNGMVMEMKQMSVDLSETEAGEDLENMTVEVFKNQRQTINGYDCYKVVASSEDFESVSWLTDDLPINLQHLFSFLAVNNQGKNPYEEKFGHITGMVMESTSIDRKSGEKDIMRLNNIRTGNPDDALFSTEGYTLMQLPDISGFGQ